MTNRQFSEVTQQGRVVRIETKEKVTRITVCSNYSYKDAATGERKEDPHFNQFVAFNQKPREIIATFETGDLVKLEGRVRQTRFTDREGNVRYGVDLVAWEAELIARKKAVQRAA